MGDSARDSDLPSPAKALGGNQHKRRQIPTINHNPRRQFVNLVAGAAALPVMSRMLWAQAFPTRPITMVIPFPAGGPTDVIGRVLSERMRASLGQPVILENVAGAAGNLGVGRVARASPDGYTIVVGFVGTHVFNAAIYRLQYDVLNDFTPITLIANIPYVIVAKRGFPPNDLKTLIAWLKANPDKASVATGGVGTPQHVSALLFQDITGTHFQFVPYRGAAPAMQDLVAGQVDIMFDSATNSLPHVGTNGTKAYAVMTKRRLASAPDIPTVDEAGLPGFYFSAWYALWAPKATPMSVISRLNSGVMEALADEKVRTSLAGQGMEIFPPGQQTPEALGAFQKAEIEKWWPIIKAANVKAE
jgi:tripartite-type tricarboxylate transporter receptor subunit TctC